MVAYLRRQDDHVLSIYQQNIRGKQSETILSMIEQIDELPQYDYLSIISRWQDTFPNAQLTIRPYGQLLNGDIIEDFSAFLNCPVNSDYQEPNYAIKNLSFDAPSIELIRLFNKLEADGQLILPHLTKRHMRKTLKNRKRGQKFKLSPKDQVRIWEAFKVNNLALCDKYELRECKDYFSSPPIPNSEVFYNEDVQNDDLYHLFFKTFES